MRKNVKDIKIYFVDRNVDMCCAWNKEFFGMNNIEVMCIDFISFMKKYKVDCVVSPANAYGLMDGGYDQAITDWFGDGLQKKVQRYILDNLYGEQPVGSSIVVDTDENGIKLIHTPTMRYPGKIIDPVTVYHCMRTCLIAALDSDVKAMVIPAFGAFNGEVRYDEVARLMRRAYDQISDPPEKIDWKYARSGRF